MKETNPNISRYLIIIVIFFFVILIGSLYAVLSSEKLPKYALNLIIEKYLATDKLNIKLNKPEGSLISGIKIDSIDIKHLKPNFDIEIKGFSFKPQYNDIFSKGAVLINANIDSLNYSGNGEIPLKIASTPAFLGYGCYAGLPGNIKISSFDINKINIFPFENKELEISSEHLTLKATNNPDDLNVIADFIVNWKRKILAKSNFTGIYNQNKNKLNGIIKLDAAKQLISSEITLANGKKGIELSGYIASDTIIDFTPLSQWLGYLWQLEYPYTLSGKVFCQGSWLYNSKVGFLGNLNGKYEKLDVSVMGLFISMLELNGNWKLFDGNLNITDTGSKLIGFPASFCGKIESLTSNSNRKWNLSFNSNSLPLDKATSSIPWMVKYSNGIPDLDGIATITINLSGNRPKINAKLELNNFSQLYKDSTKKTKTNGKVTFTLPEKGHGLVSGSFVSSSNRGLPIFFKRFSKNFYETHNKEEPLQYKYILNGNIKESIKITGSLFNNNGIKYDTFGELKEDKSYLKLSLDENKSFYANDIAPIDLLLMR